jgi:hypothetical protein
MLADEMMVRRFRATCSLLLRQNPLKGIQRTMVEGLGEWLKWQSPSNKCEALSSNPSTRKRMVQFQEPKK